MTRTFNEDTDQCSEFAYDSDEDVPPDSFSLTKLEEAAGRFIGEKCNLVKLAEGGYHKVYEVYSATAKKRPTSLLELLLLHSPKDKFMDLLFVLWKIATVQHIASHTKIPTTRVYDWNSDGGNPVGLEYMILEKVNGVSASDVWDTLPLKLKRVTVSEIADCLIQLFRLRFDTSGSLYNGPDGKQFVGPIVSIPFYRALDGVVRLPQPVHRDIAIYRGPFPNATAYLRSFLDTELRLIRDHRQHILEHELNGDEERLETGYSRPRPGRAAFLSLSGPGQPFALRMDFRLSNIMIDKETGHVTGIIDFEGTTVAPLWECAYLPRWLQDPEEWDGTYEGGSAEEREVLRDLFLRKIQELDQTEEWIRAMERRRPFREFTNMLNFHVGVWASQEEWVNERIEWSKNHPGIAYPST
ncbi:Kinase-like protein [Mycena sanguinolenta]|uniref:Kinase-like protein n=1 Tax=Mycena sanguinolenta TaxID=230812 RepID=A0A8H7DHH8_9AGAR|nr:Kinase-like protein [Mycena sanguinolenta]